MEHKHPQILISNKIMDACPVLEMEVYRTGDLIMETDGGRNQRNLVARLVIVYSGAIGASDNPTLSSRQVETPTDTFCAIRDANSGRTSPYQQ